MRKKVVGEDYVAKALENGSGDFMRPLQQFATVFTSFHLFFRPSLSPTFALTLRSKMMKVLIKFRRVPGERFGLVPDCR
jgi:4-carboxymuconolactone decarboxylase